MVLNFSCGKCVFKNAPSFSSCPVEIKNNPLSGKKIKKIKKGKIIVKQGYGFKGVYCIKSGTVKVVKLQEKTGAFLLWFADPGQFLGMDAFVNDTSHTSTAIAEDNCEVCFIPENDFQSLVYKNPAASVELMKILCSKIVYIEDRLTSLACKKIKSRLIEQLLYKALKNNASNKKLFEFAFDFDEMAGLICTTRNYLYKLLGLLSRKGLIEVKMHKIKLLDLDRLYSELNEKTSPYVALGTQPMQS